MPITELLERNAKEFADDVALVEINPEIQEKKRVTWREYELIQPDLRQQYRREITSSQVRCVITAGKLHGMYLMKRQTGLLIC